MFATPPELLAEGTTLEVLLAIRDEGVAEATVANVVGTKTGMVGGRAPPLGLPDGEAEADADADAETEPEPEEEGRTKGTRTALVEVEDEADNEAPASEGKYFFKIGR